MLLMGAALASGRAECASAERQGHFAAMRSACAECSVDQAFCEGRLTWLAQRSDPDGGVTSLQLLADARRDEATADAIAAMAIDEGASVWVRTEARLWLAAEQPDQAVDWLRSARTMAPEPLLRQVELALAKALATAGEVEEAEQVEAPHRLGPTRPSPVQQWLAQRTQRWVAGASAVLLAFFVGVTAPALHRSDRAWGLLPLTVLVSGSAVYVGLYAHGAAAGLWLFLPGAAIIHVASVRAFKESPAAWRRVLSGLATLAWGYLALWWTGTLMQVGV
ncbi:MAG: hypothetical protein KC912_09160 [Proteobacteria bacterium]|nr:hypothetical protein [Pseudomonadota bacterium]